MLINGDDAAERFRDWAKKVNQANVIQQLQKYLRRPSGKAGLNPARDTSQVAAKLPILSVNAVSDMKEVVVLSFPALPSNEVDWDERLERWMLQLPGASPHAV